MARMVTQGLHIQGWSSHVAVATVANWFMTNGQEVRSMSHLVDIAFEALKEAIIANGGSAVANLTQAQEVLDNIGRRSRFGQLRLNTGQRPSTIPAVGTKEELFMRERATELFLANKDKERHNDSGQNK